jgi:hypothetical protein
MNSSMNKKEFGHFIVFVVLNYLIQDSSLNFGQ